MKERTEITKELSAELKALYKKWPDIKRFLYSLGCKKTTDAEDIFQEALLIYTRKLQDATFELKVDPFYYVRNTCKFLWYNQSRKEGKHIHTSINDNIADYEDDWFQKEMKLKSIEDALSQIGQKCQQLLQLFYGAGMAMADIAKKLGMRNDKVAKAQKYRCINKVKDEIRSLESLSHNI